MFKEHKVLQSQTIGIKPSAKAQAAVDESYGEHEFEFRDFDTGEGQQLVLEAQHLTDGSVQLHYTENVAFPAMLAEKWERLLVGGTVLVELGDNRTLVRMINAPGAE